MVRKSFGQDEPPAESDIWQKRNSRRQIHIHPGTPQASRGVDKNVCGTAVNITPCLCKVESEQVGSSETVRKVIGQSVNSCRDRANGHRGKFSKVHHKKSALSYHVYKDHPLYIDKKLSNYKLGVIKSTTPINLDRLEDYYVDLFDAKLSLKRYKVTA